MWFSRRISEPSTASLKHTQQNCTFPFWSLRIFQWFLRLYCPHQSNTPPTAHRVGQHHELPYGGFPGEIGAGKMAGLSQMELMSLVLQGRYFWDRRFEGVLYPPLKLDINENCLWWIKVQGSLYEPGSKLLTWGWSSSKCQEGILTIVIINPYYWVDELYPLLSGNNGGWSTRSHISFCDPFDGSPLAQKVNWFRRNSYKIGVTIQWHQFCGGIKQWDAKIYNGFFWGDFRSKNSAMKVKYIYIYWYLCVIYICWNTTVDISYRFIYIYVYNIRISFCSNNIRSRPRWLTFSKSIANEFGSLQKMRCMEDLKIHLGETTSKLPLEACVSFMFRGYKLLMTHIFHPHHPYNLG